jgi:hypothetical protein
MVQNMLRNDPRLATHPMMAETIQQLASNPEMANQISQMMGDPNMQRQIQAMIAQQGGFSGTGGPMPALGNPRPGSGQVASQGQPRSSANDEELTEDEMIAEAIRRSLQE